MPKRRPSGSILDEVLIEPRAQRKQRPPKKMSAEEHDKAARRNSAVIAAIDLSPGTRRRK